MGTQRVKVIGTEEVGLETLKLSKIRGRPVKKEQPVAKPVEQPVPAAPKKKKALAAKPAQGGQRPARRRGRKWREARAKIEAGKQYELSEAIALARELSLATFAGSLELHLRLRHKIDHLPEGVKAGASGLDLHTSLGKLSQKDEVLLGKAREVIAALARAKILKATLAPTMGPGIPLTIEKT